MLTEPSSRIKKAMKAAGYTYWIHSNSSEGVTINTAYEFRSKHAVRNEFSGIIWNKTEDDNWCRILVKNGCYDYTKYPRRDIFSSEQLLNLFESNESKFYQEITLDNLLETLDCKKDKYIFEICSHQAGFEAKLGKMLRVFSIKEGKNICNIILDNKDWLEALENIVGEITPLPIKVKTKKEIRDDFVAALNGNKYFLASCFEEEVIKDKVITARERVLLKVAVALDDADICDGLVDFISEEYKGFIDNANKFIKSMQNV